MQFNAACSISDVTIVAGCVNWTAVAPVGDRQWAALQPVMGLHVGYSAVAAVSASARRLSITATGAMARCTLISFYWEVHFCASAFSYVLRSKKSPFFVILFCSNFYSLEALKACREACPDVFCSNFMVLRHWSSRLALRPASNFVSSYNFLFAAIP